jgi:hypothetical protein
MAISGGSVVVRLLYHEVDDCRPKARSVQSRASTSAKPDSVDEPTAIQAP